VSIRTGEHKSSDRETRNLENFEVFLFLDESFYKVPAVKQAAFLSYSWSLRVDIGNDLKQSTWAESLLKPGTDISSDLQPLQRRSSAFLLRLTSSVGRTNATFITSVKDHLSNYI